MLARFLPCLIAWAASVALLGCNEILGINEPEEVPLVHIYPWDGNPGVSSDVADPGDASLDESSPDADRRTSDVSAERPAVIPDSAVEREVTSIVDAKSEGPRCFLHIGDGGALCGLGCAVLCPLKNHCGHDGDCTSGRCYAGFCTPPTCLDKLLDGDESDIDCGGSCYFTCAVGQRCRSTADCVSTVCTAGTCQARPQDGSSDGSSGPDGSARDVIGAQDGADSPRPIDVRADNPAEQDLRDGVNDAESEAQ